MNHKFLILEKPEISQSEAESRVDKALIDIGLKIPTETKFKQVIKLNIGQPHEKHYPYNDLIEITKQNGICLPVQSELDRRDNVFCGTLGINATTSSALQMEFKWANFTKTLSGPYRINSSESEIAQDIIYYRAEACFNSNENHFEKTYRYYRSYLFSCIAILDAYINRQILYFEARGLEHEKFIVLKNSRNLEKKIELALIVFADKPLSSINTTKEWIAFKELKKKRNNVTHSLEPYFGISIRDLPNVLNLCNDGVAGFILKVQELQNKTTLGFVEDIKNAGTVSFVERVVNKEK